VIEKRGALTQLKQASQTFFARLGAMGPFLINQPRTDYNYVGELGDGLTASVIMPVVQWLGRAFCEAPCIVQRQTDEDWETVPAHPLAQLIARPNGFYGSSQLWMATLVDWCWFGESYWRVLYQRGGAPGEVWWLPPWSLEPRWPADGSTYISSYTYRPEFGTTIELDVEEVVHFRHGLDPRNPRHGLPPLRGVLRDVWADEEAGNWVASLLRNMGVPGLILSPKAGDTGMIGPEEMERVKAYVKSRFTGDSRGEPMALGAPLDVHKLAFSPNEFDLSVVRDTGEERVCAALGIPAAVVGFGTGLDTTKVGATMMAMMELAWSNGVMPIKRMMSEELFRTLLPAFETRPDRFRVGWDYREVKALQEDENAKATRIVALVTGGVMKVSEGRHALGLDSEPSDEIYLRPSSLTPTDPKDQMPEPEPAPPALLPATDQGNGPRARRLVAVGEQRALKQGTLGELIHTLISRHAPRLDTPPRAALRLAARLWRGQQAAQPAFERRLIEVLRRYGTMVATAARDVLGPKQSLEDLIAASVIHERIPFVAIRAELAAVYAEMYAQMLELTLKALTEAGQAELTDLSRVQRALQAAARERVGLLDLATEARAAILETFETARAQGLGEDALIAVLREQVPSGRWTSPEVRAQIIARHESRVGTNLAASEYARESGMGRVLILDARLGPTDNECEARNGWVVSPAEAHLLAGIEHPNGTLTAIPHQATVAA
jgi:HK97 family phage portal protein